MTLKFSSISGELGGSLDHIATPWSFYMTSLEHVQKPSSGIESMPLSSTIFAAPAKCGWEDVNGARETARASFVHSAQGFWSQEPPRTPPATPKLKVTQKCCDPAGLLQSPEIPESRKYDKNTKRIQNPLGWPPPPPKIRKEPPQIKRDSKATKKKGPPK